MFSSSLVRFCLTHDPRLSGRSLNHLTPTHMAKKEDNANPKFLKWLIDSRASNQLASLRLFEIFETHADILHKPEYAKKSHNLVAACFSLWRAAFLADKTGVRKDAFKDARDFLLKVLVDNAISYSSDKSSREWTFNYYTNAARDCLLNLVDYRDKINPVLSQWPVRKGRKMATSQATWERFQAGLEVAIDCLEAELKSKSKK